MIWLLSPRSQSKAFNLFWVFAFETVRFLSMQWNFNWTKTPETTLNSNLPRFSNSHIFGPQLASFFHRGVKQLLLLWGDYWFSKNQKIVLNLRIGKGQNWQKCYPFRRIPTHPSQKLNFSLFPSESESTLL